MERLSRHTSAKILWLAVTTALYGFWQRAAFFLISCVLVSVSAIISTYLIQHSRVLGVPAIVSTALLTMTLSLGMVHASVKLADGQDVQLSDLFACADISLSGFVAAATVLLAMLLTLAPGIGLLISAGILWAVGFPWQGLAFVGAAVTMIPAFSIGMRYLFLTHVMVDRGVGPMVALFAAPALVRSNRMLAALITVLLVVLNILGLLLAGLGLLVTVPLSLGALAYVYRVLSPSTAEKLPSVSPLRSVSPELPGQL